MKHLPTLTAALVVLTLAGAPRYLRGAVQKKEDVIIAELRNIQAQLAQLQASQAALQETVAALASGKSEQSEAARKNLADTKLALESIQQDLSILSERVDETNGRIGNLSQELLAMRQTQQPLILAPMAGEEGVEPPVEAGEASSEEAPEPVSIAAAAPSVPDIYNQARIDYTQGRYPLAISGFKDVLQLDPNGDLADNAHYWMGESYGAQRQYEQAISEFDIIIRDYPDSNKRPDAYLKKAMTLELMGQRSEAMLMYELVIEQFPRSPQERVARRKLEGILRTTPPRPRP